MPASGATIYVFAGPTPLDAVRRYNLYSGGGVLPPKWGLGFLHRVPTLFTAQQAADEVAQFASRGYPLDVLGLEPGWQSASYPGTFVWDRTRFPDPDAFLARDEARRRAREPLDEPLRRAVVAAVRVVRAALGLAHRVDRHRPRHHAARRAHAVARALRLASSSIEA